MVLTLLILHFTVVVVVVLMQVKTT